MNQAILFADIQDWNDELSIVEFYAQNAGTLIECSISKQKLAAISGVREINSSNAVNIFLQYRFDIEEIAEDMIEDEQFNHLDQIQIR
ncbi:DUF1488 domain-containing protein [Vibrio sp. MA40-2]|uniref:DUF1488 domain-containing protein n=1 Tax=Vibrio sp. MA40-2 TaxID=3391828 RepID=UPI0039A75769